MLTVNEVEIQILEMTARIQRYFPELSKYLSDIPMKIMDKNVYGQNMVKLKEYCNFLERVLHEYPKTEVFKSEKRQSMNSWDLERASSAELGSRRYEQSLGIHRDLNELSRLVNSGQNQVERRNVLATDFGPINSARTKARDTGKLDGTAKNGKAEG